MKRPDFSSIFSRLSGGCTPREVLGVTVACVGFLLACAQAGPDATAADMAIQIAVNIFGIILFAVPVSMAAWPPAEDTPSGLRPPSPTLEGTAQCTNDCQVCPSARPGCRGILRIGQPTATSQQPHSLEVLQ